MVVCRGRAPGTVTVAPKNGAPPGITLSPSQAQVAHDRLNAIDLTGRSRIEICDYRDAKGPYDAIASVEMVEAVGQA